MKVFSVFIADDHELARKAIFDLLSETPDFECVGQASDGTELLQAILAAPKPPDICLLDLKMPYPTSLEEFVRKLKKQKPSIKVAAYSSYSSRNLLYTLIIKIDVEGYILKEGPNRNLITALRKIAQGENYYSHKIYSIVVDILKKRDAIDMLTEREKDIFELILLDDEEIAEKLSISPSTVRKHINKIQRKLNFDTRFEILRFALEYNYINPTYQKI